MNHAIFKKNIFYRVKNDSNDDCRYGAFRDGDNCKEASTIEHIKSETTVTHDVINITNQTILDIYAVETNQDDLARILSSEFQKI
uniref:Uncharacterized protein n=1 Tax=Magallana gigas TaxID=29159 RepID=K1PRM8_MAGGI